jgi:hypothetical protein
MSGGAYRRVGCHCNTPRRHRYLRLRERVYYLHPLSCTALCTHTRPIIIYFSYAATRIPSHLQMLIGFNTLGSLYFDPILSTLRNKSVIWAPRTLYTREPSPPMHTVPITTNLLTENVPTTVTSTTNVSNRSTMRARADPTGTQTRGPHSPPRPNRAKPVRPACAAL